MVVTRQPKTLRGVQREAAPATADFQQVIRGLELELSANEVEPRDLGIMQSTVAGARTSQPSTSSSRRETALKNSLPRS